jgi:hypothetical protein
MAADHAQPQRFRPSARPAQDPPRVPLNTDFTQWLPEGGYPDLQEAGQAYAAGQRATARANESRTALTTGPGDDSTPTMYPTAYGQTSSNSDEGDDGITTPADRNQVEAEAPARAKAARKAAKRKVR